MSGWDSERAADEAAGLWDFLERREVEKDAERARRLERLEGDAPEGWAYVERLTPCGGPQKAKVTLRLDQDVLDWFRGQGRGHQTRINEVLRLYMLMKRVGVV